MCLFGSAVFSLRVTALLFAPTRTCWAGWLVAGRFKTGGIPASVGYEIGQPAYPSPVHDKQNQLPLTKDMLSSIISTVQSQHPTGGFLWEIFKTCLLYTSPSPRDRG